MAGMPRWRLRIGVALLVCAAPHHAVAQEPPGGEPRPKEAVPRELRERILRAVERGTEYLRQSQAKDGSWSSGTDLAGDPAARASAAHRTAFEGSLARIARAAEALLDAGVPAADPSCVAAVEAVEKGLAVLEKAPPPLFGHSEYAAAVLRIRLRAGKVDDRSRRLCSVLETCVSGDGLMSTVVPHAGKGGPLQRVDASGSAYACFDVMAGLDLARRCGMATDAGPTRRMAAVLARTQRSDGGWNPWPAVAAPDSLAGKSKGTLWMLSDLGSTASALAAYVLERSADPNADDLAADPVVRRGLAWLSANFTPWREVVSGTGIRYGSSRTYVDFLALVALGDRLGRAAWAEGFRWYEAGAEELLGVQSGDGSWRHRSSEGHVGVFHERIEDNTACAVIFLAAGRRARGGTASPGGDRGVATGERWADLAWTGIGSLTPEDRAAAFEEAFRCFGLLDAPSRTAEAGRFTAFGPEGVSRLIAKLEEGEERARAAALEILEALVGETLEFNPAGTPEDRERGVRGWRRWFDLFGDDLEVEQNRLVIRVGQRRDGDR